MIETTEISLKRNPDDGLDIASYAMAMMGTPFTKSHKPFMPKEWIDADFPHTHKALDDALGHAMLFCNIVAADQDGGRHR